MNTPAQKADAATEQAPPRQHEPERIGNFIRCKLCWDTMSNRSKRWRKPYCPGRIRPLQSSYLGDG